MLKPIIIFVISFLWTSSVISQQKKNTYNTTIGKAQSVKISSGSINIVRADTVFIGQLVINRPVVDSIFFLGSTSVKDTFGIYTTTYKFAPKTRQIAFAADIAILFDTSFIPWDRDRPKNVIRLKTKTFNVYGDGGDVQTSNMFTPERNALFVRGMVSADNLYVQIKSNRKLFATIYGIVGRPKYF
jgi:hypothetical protein